MIKNKNYLKITLKTGKKEYIFVNMNLIYKLKKRKKIFIKNFSEKNIIFVNNIINLKNKHQKFLNITCNCNFQNK